MRGTCDCYLLLCGRYLPLCKGYLPWVYVAMRGVPALGICCYVRGNCVGYLMPCETYLPLVYVAMEGVPALAFCCYVAGTYPCYLLLRVCVCSPSWLPTLAISLARNPNNPPPTSQTSASPPATRRRRPFVPLRGNACLQRASPWRRRPPSHHATPHLAGLQERRSP